VLLLAREKVKEIASSSLLIISGRGLCILKEAFKTHFVVGRRGVHSCKGFPDEWTVWFVYANELAIRL
jgi:hypothetical protein